MTMKVTMISWTNEPIRTLQEIWDASKNELPYEEIHKTRETGFAPDFEGILDQEIPVSEHVTFNFLLENVPVAWREQAVRHRIGTQYGPNYAVDVVPEAGITFWSQSMRIQSMGEFADKEQYHTPDSIQRDAHLSEAYTTTMDIIQRRYQLLVDSGVPMEDARNLIPLGATHRIVMTVNLRALMGILSKRGCWILQSSLWSPVIKGIVNELCEKIDERFRRLIHPPCVSGGAFVGCTFVLENERRVTGDDALPPCPMYIQEVGKDVIRMSDKQLREIGERIPEYADLWNQPRLGKTWTWESKR